MHDRVKLLPLKHSLAEEDVQKLAAASHGYVGADISALCQEAAMCTLRRHVAKSRSQPNNPEQPHQEATTMVSSSAEDVLDESEASAFPTDAAKPALQV